MKDESKYTPVSGRCLSSNLVQEVSDYTTALFIMWTVMALVAGSGYPICFSSLSIQQDFNCNVLLLFCYAFNFFFDFFFQQEIDIDSL